VRLKGSQKMRIWYLNKALFLLLLNWAKLNFTKRDFGVMEIGRLSSISFVKSLSVWSFINTFVADFKQNYRIK
jgi:hypothetical protein